MRLCKRTAAAPVAQPVSKVAHNGQPRFLLRANPVACIAFAALVFFCPVSSDAGAKSDARKDDKKKTPEPFKIQKLTQGMGLHSLGSISPDKRSITLLAKKPDQAPNLYIMNLVDRSIRPPLTSFKWGAADAAWSPDGLSVALAGFDETATFSELYTLELKSGKMHQLTRNAFSDQEPVYMPDGKRLLYTTDESPLPDAAFGILHIASVSVGGGKPEAFTEDECSSIHPGLAADGKGVLLVKVDEKSGRHSLWEYSFDGKPLRDLTERQFARIQRFIPNPGGGSIVIWGQEEPEQEGGVYILDIKSRKARELPEPDLQKQNPSVSPNGLLIAFIAPTETGAQLFLFDSSTGQIRQLTSKPARTHSPVFISNNEIIFGSDRDRENEIYIVDLTAQASDEKKKK
jgi:Tol biopolymer transport system component